MERKRISGTIQKPAVGFTVQMNGLDLATLIQMACAQRARQAVRVQHRDRIGFLFFDEGQLVHAVAGELEGELAVIDMLLWHGGDMRSCAEPFPARTTIQCSVETLLIRIAQARDEESRAAPSEAVGSEVRRTPTKSAQSALRLLPGSAPVTREDFREDALLASVRVDPNGEVVSQHGSGDMLPALVAYVACMGALVGGHLGLEPFDALYADLGVHRLVVFVDGSEMVGLRLNPGAAVNELRVQLGV